ncbi:AAA family ATPase [Lentzea sp. JNUCC 0626]|uniref:helix-turn-helix transcriptional regulator n=1 Tax=Lentzea sp. JNUCC 0626 TaxID=3367513 RepID=UPI0037490B96
MTPEHRLTGRDAQVSALTDLVTAGVAGPRTAVVLGETGSGKTSLVDATAHAAARAGWRVLAARACQDEAARPFWLLRQLLGPVMPEIAKLPPHLSRELRLAVGIAAEDDTPNHLVLCTAVVELLTTISAGAGPTIVLVDDIHLADGASHDLLSLVLRGLDTPAVAMVVTKQGFTRPRWATATTKIVELDPLDPPDAAQLVDALPWPVTGSARLDVLRRAKGNPLALIELSRAFSPEGTMSHRTRELFAHRVRAMPVQTARLLLYAAAHHDGDLRAVMRASGASNDLSGWEPAEKADLVTIARGHVVFHHPLIQHTVYECAPASRRARAHRDLADVSPPEWRAWHLAEGTVLADESVAGTLEQAAEAALRRGAFEAAARAFERSAEHTPADDQRTGRYAKALHAANYVGDSAWLLDLHTKLVGFGTDPQVRAAAAVGAAHAMMLDGAQREAFSLAHNTLRFTRPVGQGTALTLISLQASIAFQSGLPEHQRAVRSSIEDLGDDDGTPSDLLPPDVRPAVREFVRAVEEPAHALHLIRAEGAAVHRALDGLADVIRQKCLGVVAFLADEPEQCVAAVRPVLTALEAQQVRGIDLAFLPLVAASLIATGHWDQADRLLGRLRSVALVRRHQHLAVDTRALQDELRALRGEPVTSPGEMPLDHCENGATHARVLRAAGMVALMHGDNDGAYRQLRSLFTADGLPLHPQLSTRSLTELALAAALTGRAQEVLPIVRTVRAHTHLTERMIITLHHAEALLGDAEDVEEHYRVATTHPSAPRWPLHHAMSQLHHAQWLRRQRRSVDARSLLVMALDTFGRLGVPALTDITRRELRATGVGGGQQAESPLAALTAQQREIVRHAAQGLRNREIAERMYLSPRTVGSHLHQAYAKLGVRGRHQLHEFVSDD